MTDSLALIDRARAALAEAKTLGEKVEVRDQAKAALAYFARKKQGGEESRRLANEIVLRAEFDIGKLTDAMKRAPRGGKGGTKKQTPTVGEMPKSAALEAAGITSQEAARCEAIAAIPPERFEEEVRKPDATTNRLVKVGREFKSNGKAPRAKPEPPPFEPLVAASQLYGLVMEVLESWPADVSVVDALLTLEQLVGHVRERERKLRGG